jgi:hypothetical protein
MTSTITIPPLDSAITASEGLVGLLVVAGLVQLGLMLSALSEWFSSDFVTVGVSFLKRWLVLAAATAAVLIAYLVLYLLLGDLAAPATFALLVVGLTLWSYRNHPQMTRRRITTILVLRLVALAIALVTTVRPRVGVEEDPKVPSVLLIGIDLSESMTVADELGQERIAAVRKVLDKCEPTLRELREDQNVNVVLYALGPADFSEATGQYDPAMPAKFQRSDYATYLRKTHERWQGERFLRAHLVVGDGAHNGDASPDPEAARWRQSGKTVHAFAVGRTDITEDTKDVAVTSAVVTTGSPDGAVYIKTEFTLKVTVRATGFPRAKLPVVVSFDEDGKGYVKKIEEPITIKDGAEANDRGESVIEIKLKAPDNPGEIKVKVEVPPDKVPGDVNPSNNKIETYLTVTKEGVRVLFVDRVTWEHKFIRRALEADPRVDLYDVARQTDAPATQQEREDFDFDNRAYDVIVLGNVSARQLKAIDPTLPRRIAEQVRQKGVGLALLGGHATFLGTPGVADASGWPTNDPDLREFLDVLPVDLTQRAAVPDTVFTDPGARYQFLTTAEHSNHYLVRLGATDQETANFWGKLNDDAERARFIGLSPMGKPKPAASVYAVASKERTNLPLPVKREDVARHAPLLVGHQMGPAGRGRVLAFAGYETYLWQKLGQPKTSDGIALHAKFWRQLVRWLANQEKDDAAAFARPELPRLPVGGKQMIRVGLRTPGGAPAKDPKLTVKVIPPGGKEETTPTTEAVPDPERGFVVPYSPTADGEYTVKLVASGKDKDGEEVKGEASARFLAFAEVSDEKARKAANHDVLKRIASAGGGQFHRLEALPKFLKDLRDEPLITEKPRTRYYPDWRRDHSKGFLPGWLVLFVALLGTEWGLRRFWGLV